MLALADPDRHLGGQIM